MCFFEIKVVKLSVVDDKLLDHLDPDLFAVQSLVHQSDRLLL
jgi:hypothetical protein